MEAAKFVVSDAVAVPVGVGAASCGGFAAFRRRVPEQLIRWEADYGWTRRGFGQVAEKDFSWVFRSPGCFATPDVWRTFAGSYLDALDAAGRAALNHRAPCTEVSTRLATDATSAAEDLAAWFSLTGSRGAQR